MDNDTPVINKKPGLKHVLAKFIKKLYSYKKIILSLFTAFIIYLLTYDFWMNKINSLMGKTDDWQFTPANNNYGSYQQNIAALFTQPKSLALLLIYIVLFLLITISIFYINYFIQYKIISFIVRHYNKGFTFEKKYNLLKASAGFFLGSLLIIFITYIITFQRQDYFNNIQTGLIIITLTQIFLLIYLLIFVISALFLSVLLILCLLKKYAFKSISDFASKLALGLSGIGFGVLGIVAYFIISIVANLFGTDISNLSLPKLTGTEEYIGYSTGGSKDVNNFRENIKNNYLPLPTDMKYEGLFYDYYFDTGQKQPCYELFCPSLSYAQSNDPFSQKQDQFISVGLNSGIKKTDFKRKKLNLVVVLDISGSMGSSFDSYYYDGTEQSPGSNKKKIQIAGESIVSMLNHLQPEDRFGMVLFDENSYLAKPIRLIKETNMEAIKKHIFDLQEQGSTNLEAGLNAGTSLLHEFTTADRNEYENRMIVLTDAEPNTGDYSANGLLGITQNNAQNNIYTTFIGIGLDFNTELIEDISKITGANYYSVHSSEEFKHRMDEGFDYMVTPLVFDLSLRLTSPNYTIFKIYGAPEGNTMLDEILHIKTLFPSDRIEQSVKGGLVLVKLKKNQKTNDNNITATVNYKDREGKEYTNSVPAVLSVDKTEYYQNTGIRKGILLARYADLMIGWAMTEGFEQADTSPHYTLNYENGITIPDNIPLTQWERTSKPLHVFADYKDAFTKFRQYFISESQILGDPTLKQEATLLDKLINY